MAAQRLHIYAQIEDIYVVDYQYISVQGDTGIAGDCNAKNSSVIPIVLIGDPRGRLMLVIGLSSRSRDVTAAEALDDSESTNLDSFKCTDHLRSSVTGF